MRLALGLTVSLLLLSLPACRSKKKPAAADAGRDASASVASSADVPGSPAQVDEVLRASRPQLDACYRKAAAAKPDVAGSATFRVTVSPDGRVRDANPEGPVTLDPGLVTCARMAILSSQINPPPGGSSLTMLLPVELKR